MFRISLFRLSDSYKDFSSALLAKIKSSKTAVDLQLTVTEIISKESKIDVQRLPKFIKQQIEVNPKYAQKYIDGRRISVVNTLLTKCQVNKLWQQSVVIFTTAIAMDIPIKPSWEKMVFDAAPDVQSKNQVANKLRQHGFFSTKGQPNNLGGHDNKNNNNAHSSNNTMSSRRNDDLSSKTSRRDDVHDEDTQEAIDNNTNNNLDNDQTGDNHDETTGDEEAVSPTAFETSVKATKNEIKKVVVGSDFFIESSNRNDTNTPSLTFQHHQIAHVPTNALFDQYYVKQGLVKNGTELALLTEALKKRPVTCFRVNMSYPGWQTVSEIAMNLPFVEIVPWYNNHKRGSSSFNSPRRNNIFSPPPVAFQVDFDHTRRMFGGGSSSSHNNNNVDESANAWSNTSDKIHSFEAEFRRTREWIKKMSEGGLISIQSPSSLFVGSLVDPDGSDAVLDLCAAPGSKSRQILDSMILNNTNRNKHNHNDDVNADQDTILPAGVVVSNEASPSRHNLLSHLLCTNGRMPHSAITREQGEKYSIFSKVGAWDKVLVDAPCSGEGMLHKFPSEWTAWSPARGLQHHKTQLALLNRAIDLVKVGGKVVYSTCTMNPLENEAVVAAALEYQNRFAANEDEFVCEIEEIPKQEWKNLRNMESRNNNSKYGQDDENGGAASSFVSRGINEWMVPIHQQQNSHQPFVFLSSSSFAEGKSPDKKLSSWNHPSGKNGSIPNSVFTKSDHHHNLLRLHRCLRITPMNNSGFDAFFCAIIRKKRASPRSSTALTTFSSSSSHSSSSSSSRFAKTNVTAVNETKRLKEGNQQSEPIMQSIQENFFPCSNNLNKNNNNNNTQKIISNLFHNGQRYVLEQRSFSLTPQQERELLLQQGKNTNELDEMLLHSSLSKNKNGSGNASSSTSPLLLAKSTSQQPLTLRLLSEQSWNIATDETAGGTVQVVCPGNVFAHVSYSYYRDNNNRKTLETETKWKLTHFGANLIGQIWMKSSSTTSASSSIERNFVRGVPLHLLKMIFGSGNGRIENLESELLTDDISKIRQGKDAVPFSGDDEKTKNNNKLDDDGEFSSSLPKQEAEVWKQDLIKIVNENPPQSRTSNNTKQVILVSQSSLRFRNSSMFIPCEITTTSTTSQRNFNHKLVCHLDASERKKLLLLMTQLNSLPEKHDALKNHQQRALDPVREVNKRHTRAQSAANMRTERVINASQQIYEV